MNFVVHLLTVTHQSFGHFDAQLLCNSRLSKKDKIEYRAVIKYLFLKGNTPAQIKDELNSVYGDFAPLFTTVKFWAAELKRGRKSLGDDERSGRSKTTTTDENIAKVHQMVLDGRRIKMREIAEVTNMSKERVRHILNQHLGMRKLSAR